MIRTNYKAQTDPTAYQADVVVISSKKKTCGSHLFAYRESIKITNLENFAQKKIECIETRAVLF